MHITDCLFDDQTLLRLGYFTMATVANTSSMSNAQRYALLRASAGYGHPVPGPPTGAGGGGAVSGQGNLEVPISSTDDYGPVSEPTSSNTTPPPPAAPAGPIHGPAPPHKKAPNPGPKSKKPLDPMEVRTQLCVGWTISVLCNPFIPVRRNRADWDGPASFE
ncbi:hypothetical protein B9Z19DRAFT_117644 [Tuber borchii]|uniref:Uncharacterized protein n=1 Tax=Tuber borchii TaxID=42251 RepID=A0A2T6ZRE7_TUBBO|nr:hypothetical protein B9Z19DRAFT_117644 [Tuber borchii]